jgi:hypothetical protein
VITLNHILQAFEAGRAAERKLIEIAAEATGNMAASIAAAATGNIAAATEWSGTATGGHGGANVDVPPRRGARKYKAANARVAAAAPTPKAKKATSAKAARARKEAGPREKGVKAGVLNAIKNFPDSSVEEIIRAIYHLRGTGFKESSVRGTLQGLKKKGDIISQDGRYRLASSGGNSGADEQASQAMV